jgi:hypothetical protein
MAALVVLCALAFGAGAEAGESRPRVVIVLIDGLDAAHLTEAFLPTVWGLANGQEGASTFYTAARAVMPTLTNTNHVAIMTGVYADAHGIVGNMFWDDGPERKPVRSEYARYVQVETLFTVVERRHPALRTGAFFGKSRLVPLFAAAEHQRAPDVLWGDEASETEPVDANDGFDSDRRTMDAVLESLARRPFDLLFVALPDVDRSSHTFGPESHQARKALLEADRQVERLVKALERNGVWGETVLMVTADHGFVSVAPDAAAGRPYPAITVGRSLARAGIDGVGLLGAGGLETVALRGARKGQPSAEDQARLAEVRRTALAEPGVIEAWYRVPNPADGGDQTTLRHAHPDWRLDHPRVGDLILVAAPGHHFIDPFSNWAAAMSGTHGGPDVQRIPIVITGGHPRLARGGRIEADGGARSAANPDLGATAAWLLDLPRPRTIGGKAVPPASQGRVLREAFAK